MRRPKGRGCINCKRSGDAMRNNPYLGGPQGEQSFRKTGDEVKQDPSYASQTKRAHSLRGQGELNEGCRTWFEPSIRVRETGDGFQSSLLFEEVSAGEVVRLDSGEELYLVSHTG